MTNLAHLFQSPLRTVWDDPSIELRVPTKRPSENLEAALKLWFRRMDGSFCSSERFGFRELLKRGNLPSLNAFEIVMLKNGAALRVPRTDVVFFAQPAGINSWDENATRLALSGPEVSFFGPYFGTSSSVDPVVQAFRHEKIRRVSRLP